MGNRHTVKKQRCRISTLKEHYETGDKNRLIYKTLIVFGWFVHLKKFPMPAVQLGFDNTLSVEVGWLSALGDLQVHACQYKGRPRSKDFKLGNLSTAALALHQSLDHDLQQPGCCQRASCFWLQNDNNCKCTLFSGSSSCCIVNLLTKNQLGFVQQAENNISKLVAGIFCKLSEEQFIRWFILFTRSPPSPWDLRISGPRSLPPTPPGSTGRGQNIITILFCNNDILNLGKRLREGVKYCLADFSAKRGGGSAKKIRRNWCKK